jgi:class 3 adenylate cyclase
MLDDGWGAQFAVKGRELEATILFADIADFSGRTADLTPTETLAYVNNFFAWISAEARLSGFVKDASMKSRVPR